MPRSDGRQRSPAPPTATLAGVVVTDESGVRRPVRDARVTVRDLTSGQTTSVQTNDTGTFAFAELPAGRYEVSAGKPGLVRMSYGGRRFRAPGTPVVLGAGDRREGIVIVILRGGVIAGVIQTATGTPGRTNVAVLRARTRPNGERLLSAIRDLEETPVTATTDRAGEFRIFGLPPGEYAIRAGFAYYPGTRDAASAGTVTVSTGEEVRVSILLPGERSPPPEPRRFRVRGQVVHAGLQRMQVIGTTPEYVPALSRVDAADDGSFTLEGALPGHYAIVARGVEPVPATVATPPRVFWGETSIVVGAEDVSGAIITMSPALSLAGRIVLQGPAAGTTLAGSVVTLTPLFMLSAEPLSAAPADASGAFIVRDVTPWQYRISVSPPDASAAARPWQVASVTVSGREAVDGVFTITPGDTKPDAVVTLTNLEQTISGTLRDRIGRPAVSQALLLFPSDPQRWTIRSSPARLVRPAEDGSFEFRDLRAGDYRLVVLADPDPDEVLDPLYLALLLPSALAVPLAPGEHKTLDLKGT
jgi:hypothetical protein